VSQFDSAVEVVVGVEGDENPDACMCVTAVQVPGLLLLWSGALQPWLLL
jgi:hypothetical protein